MKAIVDTILLKAVLPFLKRLRQGVALVGRKVTHQHRLRHEPAEIGEQFVQVLVGAIGVIEPVVDKGFGDRLKDPQRVGAVSDLKKGDGLFDEPLQLPNVAGRPIAVPVASPPIARSEQAWSRTGAGSTGVRRPTAVMLRGAGIAVANSASIQAARVGSLSARFSNGNDMLAISAPIVGAGTMRVCNAAIVQPERDLVRLELAALHFRRQSVAALNEIGNGSVIKIALTAGKGFGTCECADRLLRHGPLSDLSCLRRCVHVDANRQIRCMFITHRSGACLKQIPKQSLSLPQPFVCQNHRFGAPYWVRDQALLVESIHRIPIERLPNPLTVVPPQQKQRKHAVIDSVGIDRHADILCVGAGEAVVGSAAALHSGV